MPKNKQCAINLQCATTTKYDKVRQSTTNLLHNFQSNTINYPDFVSMKIMPVMDGRRAKANGKYPVSIRFYYAAKAYYVSTGIDVPKENFVNGCVVGVPRAAMMNNVITQKLVYTQNVIEDLMLRGLLKTKFKSGTDIKRFIEGGEAAFVELEANDRQKLHFKTYVENHIDKCTSQASEEQYRLMLKKVATFCNVDHLYITDITVGWLKDFEIHCLKNKMTTNGVGYYMRVIRVIYNDAIDRGLVSLDSYPFRRFKIKKADTKHRNLSVDDIRAVMNYQSDDTPGVRRYADLFMLSFYFCGMNIKDIVHLTPADIVGGSISILRGKTDVPVRVRIEPEAQQLINAHKGEKYLLNFMDNRSSYDDFRKRLNQNLKKIFPYLTNYWARHSWATIAAELDISEQIIDLAQGRKPQGMSAVYINRSPQKISDANRKVIDFVLVENV